MIRRKLSRIEMTEEDIKPILKKLDDQIEIGKEEENRKQKKEEEERNKGPKPTTENRARKTFAPKTSKAKKIDEDAPGTSKKTE